MILITAVAVRLYDRGKVVGRRLYDADRIVPIAACGQRMARLITNAGLVVTKKVSTE